MAVKVILYRSWRPVWVAVDGVIDQAVPVAIDVPEIEIIVCMTHILWLAKADCKRLNIKYAPVFLEPKFPVRRVQDSKEAKLAQLLVVENK